MNAIEVDDEEFDTRMTSLVEKVQGHVQEEEGPGGVFEIARQKLDQAELEEMGRRIEQLKRDSEEELAA